MYNPTDMHLIKRSFIVYDVANEVYVEHQTETGKQVLLHPV